MLRDSVDIYSSLYRYCCAGQMSTFGRVGGVTSKHDYSECPPRAASPSPRHLSFTLTFLDVCLRGLRGEGEGKVGSDHSAVISLKKQLVRCIEAAVGCDTWIRTSLVIDCTAVLSLSLYSPFLLFTSHLWNGKSIWTEGRRVFVPWHLMLGEMTNIYKYVNLYEGF